MSNSKRNWPKGSVLFLVLLITCLIWAASEWSKYTKKLESMLIMLEDGREGSAIYEDIVTGNQHTFSCLQKEYSGGDSIITTTGVFVITTRNNNVHSFLYGIRISPEDDEVIDNSFSGLNGRLRGLFDRVMEVLPTDPTSTFTDLFPVEFSEDFITEAMSTTDEAIYVQPLDDGMGTITQFYRREESSEVRRESCSGSHLFYIYVEFIN